MRSVAGYRTQSGKFSEDPIEGARGVQVVIAWAGASESDRTSLKTDIELRLRETGMRVLNDDEIAKDVVAGSPRLLIYSEIL